MSVTAVLTIFKQSNFVNEIFFERFKKKRNEIEITKYRTVNQEYNLLSRLERPEHIKVGVTVCYLVLM